MSDTVNDVTVTFAVPGLAPDRSASRWRILASTSSPLILEPSRSRADPPALSNRVISIIISLLSKVEW